MGTNYYLKKGCGSCGHEREIHVGKSAAGWPFYFRGYGEQSPGWSGPNTPIYVKTVHDWEQLMSVLLGLGWRLANEYGDDVRLDEFWKSAWNSTSPDNVAHARREVQKHPEWKFSLDYNGFIFLFHEFS